MAGEQQERTARPRRRWLRWLLVGIPVLVLGLPILAFGLLQTGWGQRQGIAFANSLLEPSGLTLRVGEIDGLVPFAMTIASLRLDDAEGTAIAADALQLSISAGDLLGGQVTVTELAAKRLAVARVPVTPPAPEAPAAEPAWPELPVDIAVDRLDIDRLELGAALAGEAVTLTVDGSFALGAGAGAATLVVERLDGRPARLTMTAEADPARNTLALDLVAEEPAGGVVPPLLGWDHDGPWRLALQGDGPLDDWHGSLLATADGQALADLAFDGVIDLDQPRLAIAGTITPPADLLPSGMAAEQLAVDLDAGLTADSALLQGSIRARELDLVVDVEASRAAPITIDATLQASAQDLERVLAGLGLPVAGDADLRVAAHGPLDALQGSVTLGADEIRAYGWQASDLALTATFAGSPIDLVGDAELTLAARQPRGPGLDLPSYGIDGLTLETAASFAAGGAITLSGINLDAGPNRLSGTISLDPEGGPIGFDVSLAADAAVALGYAGFEAASGSLIADLAGAFDPASGLGWLEVAARGDALSLGVPALDLLTGPSPTVAASGQINSAYGFQVVEAQVALPAVTVEIAGDVPFAPIEGAAPTPVAFNVAIESLAALAEPLGLPAEELTGSLTLSGTVEDPLSASPRATIDVAGQGVQVAGQTLGNVATSLAIAPGEDGRLGAMVDAAFEGDYGPVRTAFEAYIDPEASQLSLESIEIDASGARVTGALDVDLVTSAVTGTLDLSASDLRTLASLTGIDLGGSATARVALSQSDGRLDAAVTLHARTLDLPETVRIEDLAAEATVSDLLGDPRFRGTARATTVATSAVNLDDATLEADGSLADIDFTLVATGESAYLEEPFPLAVDAGARVSLGGDATTIELGSLTADFGEEQLVIGGPMTIRSAGPALSVSDIDLSLLGGRIAGDIEIAPASVAIALEANDIALDRSAVLTGGIGFSARIDRLAVDLTGSGATPSGTIALEVSGVQVQGDPEALGTLADARLAATVAVQDGVASLEARIGNVATHPITLTLDNAMHLSLSPFAAVFDHGEPIDGQLLAQTDLADLNPIIAPSGDILLAGLADIDIAIGGVGGAPALAGDGTISNGALEMVETGLVLRELTAEIAGEGDRLTIRSLSASDPRGGRLTGSGWVDFGDGAGVDIDATFDQLIAFNTDYATVTATGAVTLEGPLSGPQVSGDITVRPAEIRFAEISTAGYVEVDAIDVNLPAGQAEREPLEIVTPFTLPLDVRITIPNALYVRGYGLESEWSGDLAVTGNTAVPIVVGTLEVLRGTVDLAGRPIEIGRGIVTFRGESPPDPMVDIEALANLDDLTISLIVSGPASSADFELQSVPSLPQDEILSRLLFGVGRGGLSGNQAFQAGRALALLSGSEGDLGLVNALRNITGITGLNVETATDAEGNAAAQIGGYVAEDVYLSVSRGTATGSGEAEISVEVLENIDIQSSVSEGGDSRVGVSFEWDY